MTPGHGWPDLPEQQQVARQPLVANGKAWDIYQGLISPDTKATEVYTLESGGSEELLHGFK